MACPTSRTRKVTVTDAGRFAVGRSVEVDGAQGEIVRPLQRDKGELGREILD